MQLRTPRDIGFAIRDRRRQLEMDQNDLAKRVGVSRKWIVEVEKGKPRAEIGLLMRTLNALGLNLSVTTDGDATGSRAESVPGIDIDDVLDSVRDDRR